MQIQIYMVVPASGDRQSVPSAVHIPDGQGLRSVLLHCPLLLQVGVSRVSTGQVAVPHTVPAGSKLSTTQVAVPESHEMIPTAHAFDSGQAPPAVQATQLPALHTLFFPQEVPSAAIPVVAQTDVPVTHEVVPVRQGSVGWQSAPAVQETQVPALQTLFVPQSVPLARFFPVSEQVMAGAQAMTPA